MQTHVDMQTFFFHQPYKGGVAFLTQLDQLILELHLNISLLRTLPKYPNITFMVTDWTKSCIESYKRNVAQHELASI